MITRNRIILSEGYGSIITSQVGLLKKDLAGKKGLLEMSI